MLKKWFVRAAIALGLMFVVIQLAPYARNHQNPPARNEPPWVDSRTRDLAVRACYDCHSNETVWPWYSNIAPVSWLVHRDVHEGRKALNFSEWNRPQEEAEDSGESVAKGSMPPWYYPWGRLTATDRDLLSRGLDATIRRVGMVDEDHDDRS